MYCPAVAERSTEVTPGAVATSVLIKVVTDSPVPAIMRVASCWAAEG